MTRCSFRSSPALPARSPTRPGRCASSRTAWLVWPLLVAAAPAVAFDGAFVLIEGGAWNVDDGPVPYVLEPNGSDDIDDGSDLDALRDAFRAWECVEGVKLRFEEQEGPGPASIDDDGQNTLFWDETGAFGLGPATLGVTVGGASPNTPRQYADIVFNGFDSSWSVDGSAVDVTSIALHEIGHFVGLDHPCSSSGGQETGCNGPERSVMTPVWSGELDRFPRADDEEGLRAMYPAGADDESGCEGPFRKGERCSCDGECVEGLVCASADDSPKVCTPTCASDAADCGAGFTCVLDAPEGDEPAPGVCLKVGEGGAPTGAICQNGGQCASGTCSLLFDLERSLCQVACTADTDCGAGVCYEGFCLGSAAHEECEAPAEGCTCTSSPLSAAGAPVSRGPSGPSGPWSFLPGLAALVGALGLVVLGARRGRAGGSAP